MCLVTTHKEFKTEKDITTFKAVIIDNKTSKWKGVYRNNNKRFLFDTMLENKEKKDVSRITTITTGNSCFAINGGFSIQAKNLTLQTIIESGPICLYLPTKQRQRYLNAPYQKAQFATKMIAAIGRQEKLLYTPFKRLVCRTRHFLWNNP